MHKILFIHHGSHKGGAPLSLLYTIQGLHSELEFKSTVGLLLPTKELHELYNKQGIPTIELSSLTQYSFSNSSNHSIFSLRAWIKIVRALIKLPQSNTALAKIAEDANYDLIYLNSINLVFQARLLLKKNFPFIWHVREYGPKIKDFRYAWIRSLLKQSKDKFFLSQGERKSWLGEAKEGTIIHNFIDFKTYKVARPSDSIREELGLSKETAIILYVGGIRRNKGITTFIETLRILKEKGLKFVALMPGSSPEPSNAFEEEALKKIKDFGLEEEVRLMAFDPDIKRLFKVCDLLIFPAIVPHFARPIIEAYAFAKPVIASNLPTLNELVKEGETGHLVEQDAAAFAQKTLDLLENEDTRIAMGKNSYTFATEHFNQAVQIKKIAKVVKQCL